MITCEALTLELRASSWLSPPPRSLSLSPRGFDIRTRVPYSSPHCMEAFHDNDPIAIRSLNRNENCLFFWEGLSRDLSTFGESIPYTVFVALAVDTARGATVGMRCSFCSGFLGRFLDLTSKVCSTTSTSVASPIPVDLDCRCFAYCSVTS